MLERYQNNKEPIDTGDKRLCPADEILIKTELMFRKLSNLIQDFHSAKSVEEKANIQQKIHNLAENLHKTS